MWPKYEEYKVALERWLNVNHPSYLREIENTEWMNNFTGKHHSSVVIVIWYFKGLILKV